MCKHTNTKVRQTTLLFPEPHNSLDKQKKNKKTTSSKKTVELKQKTTAVKQRARTFTNRKKKEEVN